MSTLIIGSYEPGTFLMRYYLKNFPYESAIFIPFSVGDEESNDIYSQPPGGEMTTERILTYIHECNHYIHDLSLSSCISEDYLRDEITYFAKIAPDLFPEIKYPIFGPDSKVHNQELALTEWNKEISYRIYLEHFLFNNSHTFSDSPKYSFLFNEQFTKLTIRKGLSNKDLLEGYVHYKSAIDLLRRAIITNKCDYVYQFKNDHNIYPYNYDESNSTIDFSQIYEDSKYTYHIARVLYTYYLSNFGWKMAFAYLNTKWPHNYGKENSMWSTLDTGFLMLLDIALTIPPVAYIMKYVEDGTYCIEDFSPVHRFLMALHIIKEYDRFPDSKEGEPYYVTLFNMIAQHPSARWLSYDETIGGWNIFLDRVKKESGDTSAGYRYRAFLQKFSEFHNFFLSMPSEILKKTAIPLISLVRGGGIKIIRLLGNHNIPYEGFFDVYGLFKMPFVKWEDCNPDTSMPEYMKNEMEHGNSLMREIIYRTISHNITDSILYRDGFTCSFYHSDYFEEKQKQESNYNPKLPPHLFCYAMDRCKCCKVNNLQMLPIEGCAVREYLILMKYNISSIKW